MSKKAVCLIISLLSICACGYKLPTLTFGGANVDRTFMDRNGSNLIVNINGVETQRIEPGLNRSIFDNTTAAKVMTTNWRATVENGAFCLNVTPKTEKFGELRHIRVAVTEIHPTREYTRWKKYRMQAKSNEGYEPGSSWKAGVDYCPKGYLLTSRLKYSALPSGVYQFSVSYNGKDNWDRQEIYLTIK